MAAFAGMLFLTTATTGLVVLNVTVAAESVPKAATVHLVVSICNNGSAPSVIRAELFFNPHRQHWAIYKSTEAGILFGEK
jgi:hypothetical protein